MSYGERLQEEALSKTFILEAIRGTGCIVQANQRIAPSGMLDLCPAARLMRFFPDYRFRWPDTEWAFFDMKSSDLIEAAAWATYVDLSKILGAYHVFLASPYGWAAIEDVHLAENPAEGVFRLIPWRGHQWACPRLSKYGSGGSGTPYSQFSNLEAYSRWRIIRLWLARCEETESLDAMYANRQLTES